MGEKIYFKPEPKKKEKKDRRFLKLFIFLFFLVAIVLVILWLLRGNKTVSGRYPENIKNESLECFSKDITYKKTNEVDSNDKEMKISMVFYGKEEFNSMSLKYTLHFPNRSESARAEALLHAQFARNLSASGYNFEKFNNKFSIIDEDLVITLHVMDGKIDEKSKDYFLVEELETGKLPITLKEYKLNYENQGFTCKSSLDNN